jgi:phosphoribosylformimino-5-aminoimidazole carboxamide ribotide isomerase
VRTPVELIPAIDLLGGRAVRLAQGDFTRVTDYGDPFAAAQRWVGEGATRLHLVDLDGARVGAPVQAELVRRLLESIPIPCQVAGGLRDRESVAMALAAGADRVVLGSALLAAPGLARDIVEAHGPERLVAALDVREGRVRGSGWLGPAGALVEEVVAALDGMGVVIFAVTAIARDGLLGGPDLALLADVAALVPAGRIIASAGVATLDDIRSLDRSGYAGAILGRALYEGSLSLPEALRAAADDGDRAAPAR